MWRYSSETDRTPLPGRQVNFACGIACSRETICPSRKPTARSKSPRTPGGPGGVPASAPSAEVEKAKAKETTAAELKRNIKSPPEGFSLRRGPYEFGRGRLHGTSRSRNPLQTGGAKRFRSDGLCVRPASLA